MILLVRAALVGFAVLLILWARRRRPAVPAGHRLYHAANRAWVRRGEYALYGRDGCA